MQLKSLLEKMIEVHASDVFIIAGLPLEDAAGYTELVCSLIN